jgi:hypothetical protein
MVFKNGKGKVKEQRQEGIRVPAAVEMAAVMIRKEECGVWQGRRPFRQVEVEGVEEGVERE